MSGSTVKLPNCATYASESRVCEKSVPLYPKLASLSKRPAHHACEPLEMISPPKSEFPVNPKLWLQVSDPSLASNLATKMLLLLGPALSG